jgi:hypothetical protein
MRQEEHTDLEVTPEIAKLWLLEANPYNRKLANATIHKYAAEMSSGNFRYNPSDAICFDRDGRLLNGQHRLTACVESGVSFEAHIVRNCDPASFVVMDSGRGRTAADDAYIAGIPRPRETASVARYLLSEKWSFKPSYAVSRPEVQKVIQRSGREIRMALDFIAELKTLPNEITLARAGYCYIRFSRQNHELANAFFQCLNERTELKAGSPILLLEKMLQGLRKRRRILPEFLVLAVTFKAWTMFRDGRTGKLLPNVKKGDSWWDIDPKTESKQQNTTLAKLVDVDIQSIAL